MARKRYNNAVGTLGGTGLTASGTTITFAAAPPFPTLSGSDYIPLVLEPTTGNTPSANFEIVYLTAYTSGATTGTISRGQEQTSGVTHNAGVTWAVNPLSLDVLPKTTNYQQFTSSGSFVVPEGVTQLRARLVGGGGSGGGAGSAAATQLQTGGSGGAGGGITDQIIPVTPGHTLTITIGAGGAKPNGGAAGGNAGVIGNTGGDTTITDGATVLAIARGALGGSQSLASFTTAVGGATWSQNSRAGGVGTTVAGSGSVSNSGGDANAPQAMICVVGGGGGGTATTTKGGGSGSAQQSGVALDRVGAVGAQSGTSAGVDGTTATMPGCGGGGGGGGAAGTGAGGKGGAGAPGLVELEW